MEVTAEAEDAWVDACREKANDRRVLQDCTPGYYNNEGQARNSQNGPYGVGPGTIGFLELLSDWRAAGDLAGLELHGEQTCRGES